MTRWMRCAALAGALLLAAAAGQASARTSFAEEAKAPAPDYARPEAWAARPRAPGPADLTALGETTPQAARSQVDVFYIHPTTDRSVTHWNDSLADTDTNVWTDASVIARQASIFNACCRVYAPRYRQAASGSTADPVNGMAAYDFAYKDVKRAFQYYLDHDNHGRPFILAGHSQGALHIYRLVEEMIDGKPLEKRFVAAYSIGVGLSVGAFGHRYHSVAACARPDQTDCIASWNTMIAGSDVAGFMHRSEQVYVDRFHDEAGRELLCVNPLTFDLSKPTAPASANLGSLPSFPFNGTATTAGPLPPLVAGMAGGTCERGVLFVPPADAAALKLTPLPGGSLHMDDMQLFYENIRQNAVLRANAWTAAHPMAGRGR